MNENIKINQLVSLKEIAEWQLNKSEKSSQSKIIAGIPSLQRGLVWSPEQVELVWDSILRGFPIGAFVVTPTANCQEQQAANTNLNANYQLLDGQQRANAITLGYLDFLSSPSNDLSSTLWIDLNPDATKMLSTTRSFMLRVTTKAHPWGYKTDDKCTRLATKERREALIEDYKWQPNERRPLPWEIYPCKISAQIPVPFFLLLQNSDLVEELFWDKVSDDISKMSKTKPYVCKWAYKAIDFIEKNKVSDTLRKIYLAILHASDYRIYVNILGNIADETCQEKRGNSDGITSIEHLFARLNTQGTKISMEDLNYSMIKAYWPRIKEPVELIAKGIMPPERLINLGMRLYLTSDKDTFKNPLPVSEIRKLVKDSSAETINIFFNTELSDIISQINSILAYNGTNGIIGLPAILSTSIARNSPDVYLLLMWLVRTQKMTASIPAKYLLALIMTLHWFASDKNKAVNLILKRCHNNISEANISAALREAVSKKYLLVFYSPDELETSIKTPDDGDGLKNWNWWRNIRGENGLFNIIMRRNGVGDELILYAQRQYIVSEFKEYNPAEKDMWETYNRPWDYDHILANNAANKKIGDFRNVIKQWVGTTGNFTAIKLEDNRAFQDRLANEKYKEESDCKNFFFSDSAEIAKFSIIDSKEVHEEQAARSFITAVKGRLIRMYKEWYDNLSIGSLLGSVGDVDSSLYRRKQIFNAVNALVATKGQIYYVHENFEYPVEKGLESCSEWLSLGWIVNDKCMIALTVKEDYSVFEFGLRKHPMKSTTDSTYSQADAIADELKYARENHAWWYCCKTYSPDKVDAQGIATQFEKLYHIVSQKLESNIPPGASA